MQELIDAIKAWPIIIQGALGSALFWLVLVVGQKITNALSIRFSTQSKSRRRARLVNQGLRLRALIAGDGPDRAQTTYFFSALLYRASQAVTRRSI
jgi:hypothetical protein